MVAHRPSEFWNGLQARLPDAFWMSKQKGEHTIAAVCEVWTHPSGWELRLIIGGAYARPQILAIDEIGYLSYDAHAADLLFQVISRRYEQRSIVVTAVGLSQRVLAVADRPPYAPRRNHSDRAEELSQARGRTHRTRAAP